MRYLKDYKRKEIKCLVVEDFETNEVFKVFKDEDIKKCLEKYSENEITKIYNPTAEQHNKINEIIERVNKGDKVYSKVDGIDMLISVIPMLTDIKVDLDKEEDIELINEIISDPNTVFNEVVIEMNKVIMDINLKWIENLKILNKLPDEIINVLATKPEGK